MKNKICTARDKDGILKRGEYTGYSPTTKKHHVSFYDGNTNAFSDINAITFESVPVFETGATSAAVNELILYTDNTRELAEKRDKYFYRAEIGRSLEMCIIDLYWDAINAYKKEFPYGAEYSPVKDMTQIERHEYCQIYANRFAEWKKERERNDKQK